MDTPLPGTSATLAVAAAGEDWASEVLASLAAGERSLRDGTALFYGSFGLLTEHLSSGALSLPAETGDPPDFATLAAEYAAVLASPPSGLQNDRGAKLAGCTVTSTPETALWAPVAPDEALVTDAARRIGGVQAANYSTFEQRLDCSIECLSRCIYRLRTQS